LRLNSIIWKNSFAEKIAEKHDVETYEVDEVLFSKPLVRFVQKGRVKGENLYVAYGQTDEGRYLTVFFIHKQGNVALPISARDITSSERRYYNDRKKTC
jgi:hypothetical protein|tara:strand:+ start:363 stop:659 length:297 start_codon:yes stop_codon:yes gene_type:complete